MISKDKFHKIMALSLPIIGGSISQNMLNLADTAMVGRLGHTAVAASGLGGFANFMSQAIILGLSSGVQAIAARRVGESKAHEAGDSLSAGLIIALSVGPILSLIMYFLIPYIVPFMNNDLEVIESTITYWHIRVVVIMFVGMNYSFRGFFNGIKMPRIYMMTLIIMHSTNIFLNYCLIFGNFGFEKMGLAGAATASSIAVALGTICYFVLAKFSVKDFGIFNNFPSLVVIKTLFRLSLPSGIQQLFFAAGFTALFIIIGTIGTKELAVVNILINIILVCILPGFGFGLAAATLISTSIGNNEIKQSKQWAYEVAMIAGTATLILGIMISVFSESIIGLFITDIATIKIGVTPLIISGLLIWTDVIGIIFMNALLGAGDSRSVLLVSTFYQWVLFLPLAYISAHYFSMGLVFIWCFFCLYRLAIAIHYTVLWKKENWRSISL